MTTKILNELKNALITLGVKNSATLKLNGDRIIVKINNEYFGIWDVIKSTFID